MAAVNPFVGFFFVFIRLSFPLCMINHKNDSEVSQMNRRLLIIIALSLASASMLTACVRKSQAQATPSQSSQNTAMAAGFDENGGPGGPRGPGGPPPDGMAPQGPPPDMNGQGGMGGPGGQGGPGGPPPGGFGGQSASNVKLSGAYTVGQGETKTSSGQSYTSDQQDVSAIYVKDGGTLALTNPTISTTGNSSSNDASSFYGLNAAVLVGKNSKVTIEGGSINSTGSGANGLFAAGSNAVATMTGGTIKATGNGGHGVMATMGGTVAIKNVNIETYKQSAGAVATDRGSGTIDVTGGKIHTYGFRSPGIYSTGKISSTGTEYTAHGAEAAVIEGQNSIYLKDCKLVALKTCGAMLYQSFSGDAQGRSGTFVMEGGSLDAKVGPLFYVTNAEGVIKLTNAKVSADSGIIVKASADRWGNSGSNGGTAVFTASGVVLNGDFVTDDISYIRASLKNGTVLTGKVSSTSIRIDASSKWNLTGDSTLNTIAEGTPLSNIRGNGHTATYDASLEGNKWLQGKTYQLAGGGVLKPK